MNIDYKQLISSGMIPKNSMLMINKAIQEKCITLSKGIELQSLNVENRRPVVSDKAMWVAYSKGNGVYSCDGEFVYKSDLNYQFIQYKVKDRLIPIHTIDFKIKNNGRFSKMENNNDLSKKLKDLNAGVLGQSKDLKSTEVFKGDTVASPTANQLKAKENQAKVDMLRNTLSNEIKDIELADTKGLKLYNKERATIIGWLTDRDRNIKSLVKTDKVRDLQTKKFVLKPNAPTAVVEALQNGDLVDPNYIQKKSTLVIKENAPGPVKVAVIRMPMAGFVTLDKLRDPSADLRIEPTTKTDYVITFVAKNELPFYIWSYLGNSIKEDARTHEDPSSLIVTMTAKAVTDPETNRTENVTKTTMSIENKKPLVQLKNYFPKLVYKTMSHSEIKTPEQRKVADFSLFGNLFSAVKGRAKSYDNLAIQDKEKIEEIDGVITSKFFDPNHSLPLEVLDVFTKLPITNPLISVKKQSPKKDGTGTTTKVETYNVLTGGEENSELNPFTSGRFDTFLEACEGELTKEVMSKYMSTKRAGSSTGTGSGTSVVLSAEEAFRVLVASSEHGGLQGVKVDTKSFGKGKLDGIETEVMSILNRVNAGN